MKRFLLLLVLIIFSQGYSQKYGEDVFFKLNDAGDYWTNYNIATQYYVWEIDSASTDTSLTSKWFVYGAGWDGLTSFLLQIDTTGYTVTTSANNDTVTFTNPAGNTVTVVKPYHPVTLAAIDFYIDLYWGLPFDTRRHRLVFDLETARGTVDSSFVGGDYNANYISTYDPTNTTNIRQWQTDAPPMAWRIYVETATADSGRVLPFALRAFSHRPNK